jgi:hypothetical protein
VLGEEEEGRAIELGEKADDSWLMLVTAEVVEMMSFDDNMAAYEMRVTLLSVKSYEEVVA